MLSIIPRVILPSSPLLLLFLPARTLLCWSPSLAGHFLNASSPTLATCERRAFPLIQNFKYLTPFSLRNTQIYMVYVCVCLASFSLSFSPCLSVKIPCGQIGAKAKETCKSQKRRPRQIEETSCCCQRRSQRRCLAKRRVTQQVSV